MPPQKPERIERGVFRRIHPDGRIEYGSRTDDVRGCDVWSWGHSTQTKARNDYQARRAAVRTARQSGGTVAPTRASIADLRLAYLDTIKGKRSTFAQIGRRLAWWAAHFKAQPVLTIAPDDVERAMTKLVDGGMSKATANRYAASLRRLMNKMVKPKSWVIDFWKEIEFYPEVRSPRPPLSFDQEDRLLERLGFPDALFARLDVLIGIRLTEFFRLRWEWIRWDRSGLDLPAFKRHAAIFLPLPAEAVAILRVLWDEQDRPEAGLIFPSRRQTFVGAGRGKWKPGPIVFDRSRPINSHNWYNRNFKPAVRAADLPGVITFHSLRRTWASRTGAYCPARILQMLGRWKDMKTAEPYCQPYEDAMRGAMEKGAQAAPEQVTDRYSPPPSEGSKLAKILELPKKSPRSSVG